MIEVIGVDSESFYKPAMRLIGRLAFEGSDWHLAHFQQPLAPSDRRELIATLEQVAEDMATDRQDSYTLLENAADEACSYGINAKVHLDIATAAGGLMNYAAEKQADLIAIGSHQKGRLQAALLGSVGRALAIGWQRSFLIGRGQVQPTGSLVAVFATDHSLYAREALNWMIAHKPHGLRKIHLLTAYAVSDYKNGSHFTELSALTRAEGRPLVEKLRELSEREVGRLKAAGFEADYSLRPGDVTAAINRTMTQERAHLLILGAQGHGFFDRLFIGSVALHQVVAEPHPVLVIRPRKRS